MSASRRSLSIQRQSRRTGKWYPHVEPSKKSVQRIKAETLRGWTNYFHHRNCTAALGKVKWHVEERVRTHLRKRYKIQCREQGFARFLAACLYQDIGLYKVPTTAPWRSESRVRENRTHGLMREDRFLDPGFG